MTLKYRDRFIDRLFQDIADLIVSGSGEGRSIELRLRELVRANSPEVCEYWRRTRPGLGVPDSAFRAASPYLFPDEPPARSFRTSGTTRAGRGQAHYSARGLELMQLSILRNARRHAFADLAAPAVVRLAPPEHLAPEMVMAYGMEHIAAAFGDPELSICAVTESGLDLRLLERHLDACIAAERPVVLIGASFAFVNACDALELQGRRFELPRGSRLLDAGGFKGRSRSVGVDALRAAARRVFGIEPGRCLNLFGMTELASQLFDAADVAVGPLGERPKGALPFAWPRVRDAHSLELRDHGAGLLEIVDLAVLDRPHAVLTGDRGIACAQGVAIVGRIERGTSRGCSLALDSLTGGTVTNA